MNKTKRKKKVKKNAFGYLYKPVKSWFCYKTLPIKVLKLGAND